MSESKKPDRKRMRIRKGAQLGTIDKAGSRMAAAEAAVTSEYALTRMPLSSIIIWESQPRDISLSMDDVIRGEIDQNDPAYDKKSEELEGLSTLGLSIHQFGIMNPPIAFGMPGKRAHLIGGQRRTMAKIFELFHIRSSEDEAKSGMGEIHINEDPNKALMDETFIEVKLFAKRPSELDLEGLGMADNLSVSLSLFDRLGWALRFANQKENAGSEVHWTDLTKTLGLNRSQAFKWTKVLGSRNDKNVKKAIDLVKQDKLSITRLYEISNAEKENREELLQQFTNRPPVDGSKKSQTRTKKVSLGTSSNLPAIQKLIMANIDKKQSGLFKDIDWGNNADVKKAFGKFLKLWEEANG